MTSYNKPGQIKIGASLGGYACLSVVAGPEIILSEFVPEGIPLQFGIAPKGVLAFGSTTMLESASSWIKWGAALLASIH